MLNSTIRHGIPTEAETMKRLRHLLHHCALLAFTSFFTAVNAAETAVAWPIRFEEGFTTTGNLMLGWGAENTSFHVEDGISGKFLRVFYPLGSLDPATMKREGRRFGGIGFKRKVFDAPAQCATLTYKVRFPQNFDFVRGGKLPGMYGGVGNSGGRMPTGLDGFSTRFMWLSGGRGQVYAYLPTSVNYGTSIGAGQFSFIRGVWNSLRQEVRLNQPGYNDGRIRVWLNGNNVVDQGNLRFRDVHQLGIDGVFFDTFFGGNDDSWRSSQDTHADFAEFNIGLCKE